VSGHDPLAGFELDLDHERVSAAVVSVPLPDDAAGGEADARYVVYLGLLDLLAEALERSSGPGPAARRLAALLGALQSVEPVLRFELFEGTRTARSEDLVARMWEKEVATTTGWLVPRLEELIRACEERLGALRAALATEEP
jgi:hypothetical protein